MQAIITFQTEPCRRCGTTGQHGPMSVNSGRCFNCRGKGRVPTALGRVAKAEYDRVLQRMDTTWGAVRVDDKVMTPRSTSIPRWTKVTAVSDDEHNPGRIVIRYEVHGRAQALSVRPEDSVRIRSQEVIDDATRVAAQQRGATITW